MDESLVGKNSEGSGFGIIKVLSQNLSAVNEENNNESYSGQLVPS
jgi:hypothetical protein